MIEVMATCHSLTVLDNAELVGDPLDIEMFNATKFSLSGSEVSDADKKMQIVKRWEFDSDL